MITRASFSIAGANSRTLAMIVALTPPALATGAGVVEATARERGEDEAAVVVRKKQSQRLA